MNFYVFYDLTCYGSAILRQSEQDAVIAYYPEACGVKGGLWQGLVGCFVLFEHWQKSKERALRPTLEFGAFVEFIII